MCMIQKKKKLKNKINATVIRLNSSRPNSL